MFHHKCLFWYLRGLKIKGDSYPDSLDSVAVGLGKTFAWCDWCNAGFRNTATRAQFFNLILRVYFKANRKYLLVQSGQRMGGNHIPDAPQLHIVRGGIGWAKSQRSLQKGLHTRPKAQSSQALAPFSGGGRSRQSVAIEGQSIIS